MDSVKLVFAYLEGEVYFPHFVESSSSSTFFSSKSKLSEGTHKFVFRNDTESKHRNKEEVSQFSPVAHGHQTV